MHHHLWAWMVGSAPTNVNTQLFFHKTFFFSDDNSDEDQSSVVRRDKKGIRVNPMIQKVP